MTLPKISRRAALAGAAALPLAAPALIPSRAAAQAAQQDGPQVPRANRFNIGEFEVTTLLAGMATRDEPQSIFGMNVSEEEFAQASAEAHIPTDKAQFFFTPTLVNTGSELILFDTGLNPAGITAAVETAGYSAADVTHVVITHMHGDHIGGLMGDGGETFSNAAYVTGQAEYDAWASMENDNFEAKVRPLADKMTFLDDGADVRPGITAMMAAGHTPGHMTYRIESGGQQLHLIADLANHPIWSVERPDWEVRFDRDKAAAAASRRKVFDMLAADGIPFIGYHMPWPGVGYVEARGDGFKYVPHSYQLFL